MRTKSACQVTDKHETATIAVHVSFEVPFTPVPVIATVTVRFMRLIRFFKISWEDQFISKAQNVGNWWWKQPSLCSSDSCDRFILACYIRGSVGNKVARYGEHVLRLEKGTY